MASRREQGSSLVEFGFLLPWCVFLFIGILDFGFFAYALIATQGAARVGAIYASGSTSTALDTATTCGYAIDQLRGLPNIGSTLSTCNSSPLTVTTNLVSGSSSPDGSNAVNVSVTYVSPSLVAIPGILPGQITITKSVLMKIRS